MTEIYKKYLSDGEILEQENNINNFIRKINNNIKTFSNQNGTIEIKGKEEIKEEIKKKLNENKQQIIEAEIEKEVDDIKAFVTDTHGDLVSLMGAMVISGVKFKENEFLYYDKNKGIYYEKINNEYYEYNLPYIGEKREGNPINIDVNNIIVVPIPDTSNARILYHLGDVLDRGPESLTSLLLCEVCENIKLAQGNHEFMSQINSTRNGAHKSEIEAINLVLARMKNNKKIFINFYEGNNDNVISYSHIPLATHYVEGFFNFLNSVYITSKYININPPLIKFLDEEFQKQERHKNLLNKIKSYLIINENEINFETIEQSFTKEEMIIIKNIVGDALVKRKFGIRETDGKTIFINDKDIFSDFEELMDEFSCGDIINFARNGEWQTICPSIIGHTPNVNKIITIGNCLNLDDLKSSAYRNKKESCITVTDIYKEKKFYDDYDYIKFYYRNHSYIVGRENNNGIENQFINQLEGKNKKNYIAYNLKKFILRITNENKIKSYDFTNDVKEVKIEDDNINVTFNNGKTFLFNKDQYYINLDCKGRNIIYAIVNCFDNFEFSDDNKDFIVKLFDGIKPENKFGLINSILINCKNTKKIGDFLKMDIIQNFIKNDVNIKNKLIKIAILNPEISKEVIEIKEDSILNLICGKKFFEYIDDHREIKKYTFNKLNLKTTANDFYYLINNQFDEKNPILANSF